MCGSCEFRRDQLASRNGRRDSVEGAELAGPCICDFGHGRDPGGWNDEVTMLIARKSNEV